MVQVGTATHNEKEVKRAYPVEEGLTAGTNTQEGREMALVYEEGTTVRRRLKRGLQHGW